MKLILLVLILLLSLWLVYAKVGIFGTSYAISDTSVSYTYNSATPTCSLIFTLNRTSTDQLNFVIKSLPPSQYTNPLPYNLMGVYQLALAGNVSQVHISFDMNCPQGVINVDPTSMRMFIKDIGSNNFTDTNSVPIIPTDIVYSTVKNTDNYTISDTIAFGGISGSNDAVFGSFYQFYGPYHFQYTLDSNSYSLKYLDIILPNVVPSFNSYSISISKSQTSFKTPGFFTLQSFHVSTKGNPNQNGSFLGYYYGFGNYFNDINGKSVFIDKTSIQCQCSSDGMLYRPVFSYPDPFQLTCKNLDLDCQYIAITGRPATYASDDPYQASQLVDGEYVYTLTIFFKKYYKIDLFPYQTLVLKEISLDNSEPGSATVQIIADNQVQSKLQVMKLSQYSTLSYLNNEPTTKTVYVSVAPVGFSTNVMFLPHVLDRYTPTQLGFIISASILLPLLSLIVVIAFVVYRRRKNNKKYNSLN